MKNPFEKFIEEQSKARSFSWNGRRWGATDKIEVSKYNSDNEGKLETFVLYELPEREYSRRDEFVSSYGELSFLISENVDADDFLFSSSFYCGVNPIFGKLISGKGTSEKTNFPSYSEEEDFDDLGFFIDFEPSEVRIDGLIKYLKKNPNSSVYDIIFSGLVEEIKRVIDGRTPINGLPVELFFWNEEEFKKLPGMDDSFMETFVVKK